MFFVVMFYVFSELRSFLAAKSANTQRVYNAALADWLLFLGAGENIKGERKFAGATFYEAMRYIENLGKTKGIKSRYGGSDLKAGSTLSHRILVLRSLYSTLIKSNLTKLNPFEHPAFDSLLKKRAQKRPTELVPFQKVKEMLEAPVSITKEGVRDRAIMAMLFGGGLRVSEVQNLRIADVLKRHRTITLRLRETKNGTDAFQTLPNWAAMPVTKYKNQRQKESGSETEFLVTEYYTLLQKSTGRRIGDKQIYRIFKSYAQLCGLPFASPHSARATAITRLLELKIPHRDVAKFSRHSSVSMVERYDKRRNEGAEKVARKLRF